MNCPSAVRLHGNQCSKIINSEMIILTPITINNHFNNANYVTKVDHLCSERHTFNFLLKKVDFRDVSKDHLLFFSKCYMIIEKTDKRSKGKMYKKRKMIIRVVSIILCVMMILGVFSILMYTLSGF